MQAMAGQLIIRSGLLTLCQKKNLFKPPHRLILGKKVKNKKEDTEREGERQRDRNEKAEALKALGRICIQ